MVSSKTSKHDRLNREIASKLKGMDLILINHEYKNYKNTKVVGEIDCFAYRKSVAFVIETKTNYTNKLRRKALSQMGRMEDKFLPRYERENGIKFDKLVWLLVTSSGVQNEGVSYRR